MGEVLNEAVIIVYQTHELLDSSGAWKIGDGIDLRCKGADTCQDDDVAKEFHFCYSDSALVKFDNYSVVTEMIKEGPLLLLMLLKVAGKDENIIDIA